MFTPKFLAIALATTVALTACNSSTTKPIYTADLTPTSSGKKGVGGISSDDPSMYLQKTGVVDKGVRADTAKDNDFSVTYSKVTRSNKTIEELVDGDHLQDGDRYKIDITAGNKSSYIYVYQIDSKGKLYDLLKIAGKKRNPFHLEAGQSLSLPNDGESYVLDNAKGMENIVVVASDREDPSLERIYREAANDFGNNPNPSKKPLIASKGPRPAVIADTGDKLVRHEQLNLSGMVSTKKFSCDNQPACASSISFFNNM
jgi:hypothetical protein